MRTAKGRVLRDTTHGDGRHNAVFREHFGCARLLLHAHSLALPHPATGAMLRLVAPIDGDFRAVVERLGWGAVVDRLDRRRCSGSGARPESPSRSEAIDRRHIPCSPAAEPASAPVKTEAASRR